MGIFTNWIKNSTESKEEIYSMTIGSDSVIFPKNKYGVINSNNIIEIPAVYSAIELICNTVSSLDIKLYVENDTGVEEVKRDTRLYCFNDEPNILMTGVELKKAIVRDYLIYGNAYVYIKDIGNKITLHYVPASKVNCFVDETNPIEPQVTLNIQGEIYYPHEFIILTKNTYFGVIGRGILDECQELLKLAYSQNEFTLSTLANGGIKRGVLKAKKPLTQEGLNFLRQNFEEVYDGKKNTIILNEGVEYLELQQSAQEMELVNLRNSINKEILSAFDIPENLFNNNIPTEMWQMFIKSTINPILSKIEQALNKALLSNKEKGIYYFAFDTKQLMKGDVTKRFEAYEKAIKNGIMTRNEARFEEDLKELKGLDTITLSLGEVLLNTKTGDVYSPNTSTSANVDQLGEIKNDET